MAFVSAYPLVLLFVSSGAAALLGADDPSALEHRLDVDPADPLLAYRWDGGPEIPAPSGGGTLRIPYGEAGAGPTTVLYAPCFPGDDPATVPFAGGFDGAVRAQDVAWTDDGRFGSALALPTEQAELTLEPREGPLLAGAWSIELWVRLEKPTKLISLARAPGVFDVVTGPLGVCRVELATEPPLKVWGATDLRMGEWNHIGLTIDGPDLPQARLSVNGVARGRRIEGAPPVPSLAVGGFVGAIDELRVDAYPLASVAFEERFEARMSPGERVLELRYADRTETVRTWWGALTDPIVRGAAWDQGEREHADRNADRGSLFWTAGHWERYRTTNPPLPRTTHPTVYVGDHRVLIFGGETRDSHVGGMVNTNDTWIFHTDTGEWVRSRSKLAPPPSCHQSAAYSPDHGVVLYPGGHHNQGGNLGKYDETWLYFVEEDRWERREPGGMQLGPRSDGAVVYHPGLRRFVAFLGRMAVATYDPEADVWEDVSARIARGPDRRPTNYVPGGSPMAGYDPASGRIVLFGGARGGPDGETRWQDLTAFYDLDARAFLVQDTPVAPPGRVRAGFAFDSRRARYTLFGGVLDQFSVRMDDLWVLEPEGWAWTRLEASNPPTRRGGFYHMAYDPDLDRFLLLCGRHSHMIFSNEAWSLHVDETAPGRATYVFDRAAFPGLEHWFVEWTAADGARVDLRFRGGPDGSTWEAWGPDAGAAGDARFVQVELELHPGAGAAPEVLRMGFAAEPPADRAPEAGFATTPVPPFVP
jgi:hypothetical protein